MATLKCPKCGAVNPNAQGTAAEACPACGVIYAKALQAATGTFQAKALSTQPARAAPPVLGRPGSFTEQLRAETNYPAFRAVAGFVYIVGVVLALCVLFGAGFALYRGSVPAFIGGLIGAAVLFVLSKAAKEAALMFADMSDATIRMAERQERGA